MSVGKYSEVGSEVCILCPAGYACYSGCDNVTEICTGGTYSAEGGS